MDIKQDPNAIPNFNPGGRIGELQPDEPEEAQSSVQLDADPDEEADGAASAGPVPHGKGGEASETGPGAIDGLVGAP